MPLGQEAILHYQKKCDPLTCPLCKAERERSEAADPDEMRQVGVVDVLGIQVPVWMFGKGPRLYAGGDLSPDTLRSARLPVFSARSLRELQATIDVAITLHRMRRPVPPPDGLV